MDASTPPPSSGRTTEIVVAGVFVAVFVWVQQGLLLNAAYPSLTDRKSQFAFVFTLAMNGLMCARTLALNKKTDDEEE
jgi:hypothetical protein